VVAGVVVAMVEGVLVEMVLAAVAEALREEVLAGAGAERAEDAFELSSFLSQRIDYCMYICFLIRGSTSVSGYGVCRCLLFRYMHNDLLHNNVRENLLHNQNIVIYK
jgi:hypothetical protein